MANKIILSADSTCDLAPELRQRYNVQYFYFHILIGENSYVDGKEIQPDELYAAWREKGILPKTAAITPAEYHEFFEKWVRQGYDVVHINLGSAISSAHQNCCITAKELGHVYPVDSASLSTGFGHLVVKAGEMIEQGFTAPEIQQKLVELRSKTHASFVLDTLEFMRAGGRCSAVAAIGANLLRLKPGIKVDNQNGGKMGVGKKYRGVMEKVLVEYTRDQLEAKPNLDLDRVFITHSGSPESDIELVKREIKKYANFKETYVTRASGTISAHCGPRTLGVLYMTK
ncbi:MAG: DegV family protein [Oscillospiraceae bacterium]